jgi:heme exporter protein CcmD
MSDLMLSAYRDYILGAYGAAFLLIGGLIVWNIYRSRSVKKRWDKIKSDISVLKND